MDLSGIKCKGCVRNGPYFAKNQRPTQMLCHIPATRPFERVKNLNNFD